MGFFCKSALRTKLMSPAEQDDFVRTYGEAVRPVLEATLDAKVEELATRYAKSWDAFGQYLTAQSTAALLVSREEAAEMLGVSVSSIQRLEKRGELPKPRKFGERLVRHKMDDIVAFAKQHGLKLGSSNP